MQKFGFPEHAFPAVLSHPWAGLRSSAHVCDGGMRSTWLSQAASPTWYPWAPRTVRLGHGWGDLSHAARMPCYGHGPGGRKKRPALVAPTQFRWVEEVLSHASLSLALPNEAASLTSCSLSVPPAQAAPSHRMGHSPPSA